MKADRGAAPRRLLSEPLAQRAPPRVERLPSRSHQTFLLLGHGLAEEPARASKCVSLARHCRRHGSSPRASARNIHERVDLPVCGEPGTCPCTSGALAYNAPKIVDPIDVAPRSHER